VPLLGSSRTIDDPSHSPWWHGGQLSVPGVQADVVVATRIYPHSLSLSFVPPNKKRGGGCSLSLGQTKAAAATQQATKNLPFVGVRPPTTAKDLRVELFLFVSLSLEWLCSVPFLSLRARPFLALAHTATPMHGTPGNDDQEMCLSLFSACLATPSFHALLTPCPSPTPIHITTRTTGLQGTS